MPEIQIITLCNLLTEQAGCLMQGGKRSVTTPLSDLENKQWNNVKIFGKFSDQYYGLLGCDTV
jgi:hypothetical protein